MSLSKLEQTLLDALNAQEIELQSAHDRMNSMQQQIDQLAESLSQSVSWQSELITRLNALESLFENKAKR